MFQYDMEGSELQFRDAPPTQSIHSFFDVGDPGTKMIVHRDLRKYTILNKGKCRLKVSNDNLVYSGARHNPRVT